MVAMRTILRRFSTKTWIAGSLLFTFTPLYTFYEDHNLTPLTFVIALAMGIIECFVMAWAAPFSARIDTKIKRFFTRGRSQ